MLEEMKKYYVLILLGYQSIHDKFEPAHEVFILIAYTSHCQNSSKFLSVSYLMKTADVIMNISSSHNTTDHT